MLADRTDADVIAVAEDDLEAAVQVFYVRGGRVRGQRGWVVDKVEDQHRGPGRPVPRPGVRRRLTDDGADIPRTFLVPTLPPDVAALSTWSGTSARTTGDVWVPP